MTAIDVFYLPKRTFLWAQPAQIIIAGTTISVVAKKGKRVLFTSSVKKLHTGKDPEMSWTVLSEQNTLVRVMFSSPVRARNLAFAIVAVILVGAKVGFGSLVALVLAFAFFRPWLSRQEGRSEAKAEFLRQLMAATPDGKMPDNVAAVDDYTVGTNKVLGGWREWVPSLLMAFFEGIFFAIAYFVGIYGADRAPGYRFLVVWGVAFSALLGYHIFFARRTSVEYFKLQRREKNIFGRYMTLAMLPMLSSIVAFTVAFSVAY